jgi:glycosyltransferase involved in cell wall biosynthesis
MVDKISVVIPTHERPALLREALESVLAQSRQADEIIVVDDADDRSTCAVVHELAELSPDRRRRLRYLVNDGRAGASASRNLGVAHASGDVVALLDDDDRWMPSYLDSVVGRFKDSRADFVITSRVEVRGRWSLPCPSPREGLTARDVLAVNPGVVGSNICIRRMAFDLVSGFDEMLPVSNDKDFFLRLLQSGATYAVVKERLVLAGRPTGQRLTQADARRVAGMKAYYEKHFDSCLRHHHRELRRKIRRAEWRVQRDRHARGWRRHLYTLGLLALARPRTVPTLPRLKGLLIASHDPSR